MSMHDPANNPGYLLWQLNHVMQQRMTVVLEDLDLNLTQVGALVHIATTEETSTADVARRTLITPQNAGLTVGKLVRLGLVTRRRHEIHGRIKVLDLTPKGMRLMSKAVERLERVESEMLARLSENERRRMLKSLGTCLKTLQESVE